MKKKIVFLLFVLFLVLSDGCGFANMTVILKLKHKVNDLSVKIDSLQTQVDSLKTK